MMSRYCIYTRDACRSQSDDNGIYQERYGFFLVPWKDDAANEEAIKEDCKATIRCYPLDMNSEGSVNGKKCFYTGKPATHMAIFARAF